MQLVSVLFCCVVLRVVLGSFDRAQVLGTMACHIASQQWTVVLSCWRDNHSVSTPAVQHYMWRGALITHHVQRGCSS
jgi:hypothetical protein